MKIINLEKRLGNFHLKIPHLEIKEGMIHGFIGGNGSGKTTLCKLIMGILHPEKGWIDYGGLNFREITMTSQKPYFIDGSVYDNICYPLKLRKQKPDEEEIDRWLWCCGLEGKKHQYARSLSSGEQQKVSMLRAVIFRPKVIMIDETLSNLDPKNLEFFEDIIMQIQRENPITWVIISHRLALIYKMCDEIHFMKDGSILESGTAHRILFESDNEDIRRFVTNEVIVEGNDGTVKS